MCKIAPKILNKLVSDHLLISFMHKIMLILRLDVDLWSIDLHSWCLGGLSAFLVFCVPLDPAVQQISGVERSFRSCRQNRTMCKSCKSKIARNLDMQCIFKLRTLISHGTGNGIQCQNKDFSLSSQNVLS